MMARGAEARPSVSAIIPVYNAERTLARCLDSVLGQRGLEVEAVCVDDGSTDRSLRMLQEYARRDPRMVVLSQENAGPGTARNVAMRAARGEFLFFIDSDDCVADPFGLERLYTAAKEHSVLAAGGNLIQADESGELCRLDERRMFAADRVMRFSQTEDCYGYTRYIFDRETLLGNGVFFPSYRRGQDPVFMTLVMDCIDEFQAINYPVYTYFGGYGHVRWSKYKACDHYAAFADVLDFSSARGYRYMHTAAVSHVINKELLVYVFSNAAGTDDAMVRALYSSLEHVNPNLLLNGVSIDAFRRDVYKMALLLAEGTAISEKALYGRLFAMRTGLWARSILAGLVKRVSPRLTRYYQRKHSITMGNYDKALPAEAPVGWPRNERGCS